MSRYPPSGRSFLTRAGGGLTMFSHRYTLPSIVLKRLLKYGYLLYANLAARCMQL